MARWEHPHLAGERPPAAASGSGDFGLNAAAETGEERVPVGSGSVRSACAWGNVSARTTPCLILPLVSCPWSFWFTKPPGCVRLGCLASHVRSRSYQRIKEHIEKNVPPYGILYIGSSTLKLRFSFSV